MAKRPYIPLTADDIDDIIRMRKDGAGIKAFADWIGCATSTVTYYCKKQNLIGITRWTEEMDRKVVELYINGESIKRIGESLVKSGATVIQRLMLLRKAGIDIPFHYPKISAARKVKGKKTNSHSPTELGSVE